MKIVETEAIVLKSISLSEADKIVTCLTLSNGLARVAVRGAKRLKSRFTGKLELFTVADIIYAQKEESELARLFQAEIIESYFRLAPRLNTLNAMSYWSELLIAVVPPNEPVEKVYRMTKACAGAIANASEDLSKVRLLVIYFEIWLLRLSGFLPDWLRCAACGQGNFGERAVYYRAGDGKMFCQICAATEKVLSVQNLLKTDLYKVLRAALKFSPERFVEIALKLSIEVAEIETITRRLWRRLLEREPIYWFLDFEKKA